MLAARDLDRACARLGADLGLGEAFSDPAVAHFGLQNAVYAIGETFLEVVSPVEEDTAAGRLLDRRGEECGYMVMFQVDDLETARERAASAGVREVFTVELDDIREVHLHPADMRGAIVSISEPKPPEDWRWGGPGWRERSVPGRISAISVAVADPDAVRERWAEVLGGLPDGVDFVADPEEPGLSAIELERAGAVYDVRPVAGG